SDGNYLATFEGPEPGINFMDGKGEGRYVFSLNVDFFNPERVTKRGRTLSVGIISMACLNLPTSIRYKPACMHLVGLITGRAETHDITPYREPVVDEFEVSWKRGVKYSKTSLCPDGLTTRSAIILHSDDLPARSKALGYRSSTSHHICTT